MSPEAEARLEFAELLARPDEEIPLDHAALLIARSEYPSMNIGRYLARLDEMAAEVRPRLSPEERGERLVAEINAYLFGEESFRGNAVDYYDPRNSYLNDVLERRTGIPITLSLVYIELGRRLGLDIEGVGLPGHFIVRFRTPDGGVLVDPFGHGEVLTVEDCRYRVRQMYGQAMRFTPELLRPTSPREILARMLGNLKGAYLRRGDARRAVRSAEWALTADPERIESLRELGLLRYRAGDMRGAIHDLTRFLRDAGSEPEFAPVVERTKAQLAQIEELWARRN